jgi:hypothetical protein
MEDRGGDGALRALRRASAQPLASVRASETAVCCVGLTARPYHRSLEPAAGIPAAVLDEGFLSFGRNWAVAASNLPDLKVTRRQKVSVKDARGTHLMRRRILPLILGGALAVAAVTPAAAARSVQSGGAAGLVAAVVQVAVTTDDVNIANHSLNNLLRNADIDVLNNILNNSVNQNTILSNIDIRIVDVLNDNTVIVSVLSGPITPIEVGQLTVSP